MSTSRRPGAAALVLVVAVALVIAVYVWNPLPGVWIAFLPLAVLSPANVLLGGRWNDPLSRALDRVLTWWRSRKVAVSPEAAADTAIYASINVLHHVLTDPTSSDSLRDRTIVEMEDALSRAAPVTAMVIPGRGMLDLAYRRRYLRRGWRDDLDKAIRNARQRVHCVDQHPVPLDGRERANARIIYAEWLLTRADLSPNAADLDVAAAASAIARRVGNERQRAVAQSLYEEAVSKRSFLGIRP